MAKPTLNLIPLSPRSVPDFLPEKLAKIHIEKCQRVYGYAQTFERLLDTRPNSRVVGDFSTLRTAERGRRLDDGG